VDVKENPVGKAELRQVMVGRGLAMLLSALDQTIVVTAMPTIGADVGDIENLPWIVTAYLVAATVVTPLYGKLADIHGCRIMLLIGVSTFVAGSIACALAPNLGFLAAARAVQGLGGGGLISLAQTIVADMVSPRERGRYQTYFAAVFVTSSVAGPALGGFFAQYLHWSLIFWINLPLGLAAFLTTNARLKHLAQRRHPHRVDYFGAAALMLGSGLLALALGWGGARYPWGSAPVLSLLAASLLFWTLFAWRTRTADEPLVPLAVLGDAIVRNAILSSALGLGAFIGLSVVMPIYFEAVLGLSADRSGLALIPLMVGTVAGATVSGRVMAHVRHYKAAPLAGLGLATLAAFLVSFKLADLSLVALDALATLVTIGVGAMLPVATVCVQNAVNSRDLGTATAVMQFFRQLGGALIVALFGALIMGGGHADVQHELRAPLAMGAGDALIASFRLVFLAVSLCVGLSFVFLARMEERPLRGGAKI
jgi:EmrB/QacA subfamily drug resistance transporter